MTASVTMRMWRSTSCASWRPDQRHGGEPREPSYADWTHPQRRAAAPLPLLDASRLRCGSACLRTSPSARDFQRPWANPSACVRGCRRGSRSYPQFRCTNLTPSCAQTSAVNKGLYSSHIVVWRRARDTGALAGLTAPRGRPRNDAAAAQIARLQAEKKQLELELAKARFVVDVQAKLHALLETISEGADTEPRSTP